MIRLNMISRFLVWAQWKNSELMDASLLVVDLNNVFGWELMAAGPDHVNAENELETQLAEKINVLIQRDFGALVQLLYRIDVSEVRLRQLLDSGSGEDAGVLIARLIMERQWQKIESRRRYRQDNAGSDSDTDVERW